MSSDIAGTRVTQHLVAVRRTSAFPLNEMESRRGLWAGEKHNRPVFAQNHFSCCVKDRMKAGAKDGSRGSIRRGAPGVGQGASRDVARSSRIPDLLQRWDQRDVLISWMWDAKETVKGGSQVWGPSNWER